MTVELWYGSWSKDRGEQQVLIDKNALKNGSVVRFGPVAFC
jgi:hypothetical protein